MTPLALTQVGPIFAVSLPITIVQAAARDVRLEAVTERTLIRCGYRKVIVIIIIIDIIQFKHNDV